VAIFRFAFDPEQHQDVIHALNAVSKPWRADFVAAAIRHCKATILSPDNKVDVDNDSNHKNKDKDRNEQTPPPSGRDFSKTFRKE